MRAYPKNNSHRKLTELARPDFENLNSSLGSSRPNSVRANSVGFLICHHDKALHPPKNHPVGWLFSTNKALNRISCCSHRAVLAYCLCLNYYDYISRSSSSASSSRVFFAKAVSFSTFSGSEISTVSTFSVLPVVNSPVFSLSNLSACSLSTSMIRKL